MELRNVTVEFTQKEGYRSKPLRVLDDVSLEIPAGGIVALVGESGCGKTTLGKVVTGLLKPTSGSVWFESHDIWNLSKADYHKYRHSVQLVQQDSYAALNPYRTILRALGDPLLELKLVRGTRAARDRVCELLNIVELTPPEQFLDKYPHQLSGGQRQRVLMARAISLNPRLIVADEPVSMIDVSLRLSILRMMTRLNQEFGIAFVYITHDLATARYIAQHGQLVVMYLGKVVEMGSMSDVLADPRHPYLQALLTAVPVPDPRIARRQRSLPIKGVEIPSLVNPPRGCAFHPRCPYADNTCTISAPPLTGDVRHRVACHHPQEGFEWITASAE